MHGPLKRTEELVEGDLVQIPFTNHWVYVAKVLIMGYDSRVIVFRGTGQVIRANNLALWAIKTEGE